MTIKFKCFEGWNAVDFGIRIMVLVAFLTVIAIWKLGLWPF